MARIEYRSKEFPELAKLRMQARGLALVQGKTMAQVFTEALQLWMKHNCGEGMNQMNPWYQLVESVDAPDKKNRRKNN
ncbi:MAG: hypothetical protein ACYDHZ_10835 [Dehalococcoidia bacterium]|jgi:hypothetical protein